MNDQEFLDKLQKATDQKINLMSLDEINQLLTDITPPFKKRGIMPNEFTILNIADTHEYEGLIKTALVDMIPPGPKSIERIRQYFLFGLLQDTVIVPIYLRHLDKDYLLLISQNRLPLGRKVSIEVNRGFVSKEIPVEEKALALLARKMPYLYSMLEIVSIANLGFFWENTGLTGRNIPIQALFCKSKFDNDLEDLKRLLKEKHIYIDEPIIGPPIHNTEPVLRTLDEVNSRLDEILDNPENTSTAAYINDLYSQVGIFQLFKYIEKNGLPF